MRIRLVLADDQPIFRASICSLLARKPDLELVGEAEDGRAALERVRQHRPEVALLDVAMPHMNGIEAARRIKAEMPAVRVLALSQHPDRRYVDRMLQVGASGYVLKRVAFFDLVPAIRIVSQGQTYLSPALSAGEPACPVKFHLDAPRARQVFLAGSFNRWTLPGYPLKKEGQGGWTTCLQLPPGTYEYRFLVDDQWHNNPDTPRVRNGYGSYNNLLWVKPTVRKSARKSEYVFTNPTRTVPQAER